MSPGPASASEVLRASVAGFRRIALRESGDVHETPVVRPAAPPGRDEDAGAWPERIGPFQVSGEIARGGVGVILKARDIDLGRDVALKMLHREHRASPDLIRRFIEEAQIGSQLQHPGIVPVHGMGMLPDGLPYFVMKLVKGRTLAAILEERRDASEDRQRLLGIFERVCRTLAYAHARRVVHRDLKPSNIMVGAFGEVQVMDWGLAKVLLRDPPAANPQVSAPPSAESIIATIRSGSGSSQSLAGSVLGTPAYMAPEQARGELDMVDARSDVFGLGAILCEILTGRPPYRAETIEEIHRMARKGYLDEALACLASCHAAPELVDLAQRCLAFEQRDRPPDAGAVAREVKEHLESLEERARISSVQAIESATRAREERRARKLLLVFSAALLVLFAVGGGSLALLQRERVQRTREADALARTGLEDLHLRLGEARASPGDAHRWEAVLAAAMEAERRGKARVSSPMADDLRSTIDRARSVAARANEAIERAERDRKMAARLEELRTRWLGSARASTLHGEYRKAFRAHGIDPEALPAEVAGDRVRQSGIPLELTAGLHDWASVKRKLFGKAGAGQRRLLDAANAADPDPGRGRLRGAMTGGSAADEPDVFRLAAEARRAEIPRATLYLIAEYLDDTLAWTAGSRLVFEFSERIPDEPGLMLRLAYDSGNVPHALAAVALRPGNPTVLAALANLFGFARGDEGAMRLWASEAVRLAPVDPETLNLYACSEDLRGRAPEVFERIFEIEPFDGVPRHNYALFLSRAGEAEAAIASYREALRLDRSPITLSNLGYLLRARGDTEGMLSVWLEALRSRVKANSLNSPGRSDLHNEVARILRRKGDLAGAAHHLRRAQEALPARAWTWFQMGSLRLQEGRTADALAAYQRGLELDRQDHQLIMEAAYALDGMRIESRDPAVERALSVFGEAVEGAILSRETTHPRVHGILLRAHEARLDLLPLDEAREEANRLVKRRGSDIPDLLALRARVAHRDGDGRTAVSLLEDARRKGGGSPQLLRRLDQARAGVHPDLATFASIDAALEEAVAIVREGERWKYFRGESAPSPGLLWTHPGFDDSGWEEGQSGFGYGDGDDATLLADMAGRYTALYARKKVDLPAPGDGGKVELRVRSDDGFIAWINGEEACRLRAGFAGLTPASDSRASSSHEALEVDIVDITRFVRPGENTIALLGLNDTPGSSDFTLLPEIHRSHGNDPAANRKLLDSLREAARGDDAGARVAYLEGSIAAKEGRSADALAAFERAAAAAPRAPEPMEGIVGILDTSERRTEILGRLDAAFAVGLEGTRPLLERWLGDARVSGRSWDAILDAWPRRADPYEILLLPRSTRAAPVSWKYSWSRPPEGWEKPDADDSSWREGRGRFASRGHPGGDPGTVWNGSDVWLRREIRHDFPTAKGPNFRASLVVRTLNDDEAEIYLNGVELVRFPRWTESFVATVHRIEGVLREGRNVIAVHCHNQEGAGVIDVELGLRIETLDRDP